MQCNATRNVEAMGFFLVASGCFWLLAPLLSALCCLVSRLTLVLGRGSAGRAFFIAITLLPPASIHPNLIATPYIQYRYITMVYDNAPAPGHTQQPAAGHERGCRFSEAAVGCWSQGCSILAQIQGACGSQSPLRLFFFFFLLKGTPVRVSRCVASYTPYLPTLYICIQHPLPSYGIWHISKIKIPCYVFTT
ncbi:hypothetical protein F4802DRAFT_366455 [Xylaria palmicola]|nr:hypothetical protein F4802DRAFT_366455 [Xylaria palmicola]